MLLLLLLLLLLYICVTLTFTVHVTSSHVRGCHYEMCESMLELLVKFSIYFSVYRLLQVVDAVLNTVETTPEKPFEFAAPQLGVRVEDPPLLDEEEFFQPNFTGLLSKISTESSDSMQTDELPLVMVSLASAVLQQNDSSGNGTSTRVAIVIYRSDALFQQRVPLTSTDSLLVRQVGSIILDISLRRNDMVENVESDNNSNIVRPFFMKTTVSELMSWCMY